MLLSLPAFPNTPNTSGMGSVALRQAVECMGNQDAQNLKNGVDDRIMGFCVVVGGLLRIADIPVFVW